MEKLGQRNCLVSGQACKDVGLWRLDGELAIRVATGRIRSLTPLNGSPALIRARMPCLLRWEYSMVDKRERATSLQLRTSSGMCQVDSGKQDK